MISGPSTDYSGRRVDLSLFPKIQSAGIPADMEVSSSPKVIAGPSKAAQAFARILFSTLGEFRADPDLGTLFLQKMNPGFIRYPNDIDQIFTLEASRAIDYWNEHSVGIRPLDEQLQTAKLVDFNLGPDGVDMTVEIQTRDGRSISFLLPVNWSN